MNAPAQPVPQKILAALRRARSAIKVQKRRDERDPRNPFDYFDAEDVVPAGFAAFSAEGLDLLALSWWIKPIGNYLGLSRSGWLCHKDGDAYPLVAEWTLESPAGTSVSAALTQSTSALYRVALDLVKGEGSPSVALKPAQPAQGQTRSAQVGGKTPKARHIGALARANGQTVPEDVSEKDEREARDELARVEAEAKANADPRFKDEKPIADPPGLMEDEPAVPPGHIQKADSAGLSQPVDTATPSSAVLGGDLHRNGDTPQTRTEIPAPPVEGTSSSAGHSNDGPNFLDQGEWSGVKSESSAGGESLPPSSSSPPAPGPSDELVQPTPEQVALVASKASGVLAKRSAEGRAAPWTHAKLTKARKYFPCSVCQPDGVEIEVKAAIQFRAHYRDAGSGKRACLPCWERLESEAAGAGKAESAA